MANKNDLVRLKDKDGVYVCPVTKASGVFMDDGTTTVPKHIENEVAKINSSLDSKSSNDRVNDTNVEINELKSIISKLTDVIYLGDNYVKKNSVVQLNMLECDIGTDIFSEKTVLDNLNNNVTFYNFGNASTSGLREDGLLFNGTSSIGSINDFDRLRVKDEITIELCLKIDSTQTQKFIISKGKTGAVDFGVCLWSNGNIQLYDDKNRFITGSSIKVPDDGIHFYQFTLTKSGNSTIVKSYLDGNLVNGSTVSNITFNQTNSTFCIGKSEPNSNVYVNMTLRYFAVYDRPLNEYELRHNIVKVLNKPFEIDTTSKTINVHGVNTKIWLPKNYDGISKLKWIIFNHGYSGTANDISTNQCGTVLQDFLNQGYVVVGSDYTNSQCWGNEQSTIDINNLVNYYKSNYSLEDKPYVFMQSMGGIVTLNSIVKGRLTPKAVFGVFPVCNLKDMYTRGSFTISINNAYGITSSDQYESRTNGYDPMLADFNIFKNIPFLIISSYEDTSVNTPNNRDLFINKLKGVGGYGETVDSTGNHGDLSNYDSKRFIRFIESN